MTSILVLIALLFYLAWDNTETRLKTGKGMQKNAKILRWHEVKWL